MKYSLGSPLCAFVIALSTFAFTACRNVKSNASDLSHDVGHPVNSNAPYQWMGLDRETYISYMAENSKGLGISPSTAFPVDHPSKQRAQYWVDQIDAHLRSQYSDDMKNVLKPEVLVVRNNETNAFVANVTLCTGYTLASPSQKRGNSPYTINRKKGRLTTASPGACIKAPDSMRKDMEQRIRWHFSTIDNCKLGFEQQKITLSKECGYQAEEENELYISTIPNIFVVYTQLLLKFSEEESLAVFAHELGHYYKAHTLQDEHLYDYPYRLGEHNPDSKPSEDPSLKYVKDQIDSMKKAAEIKIFKSVQGQRYHTGTLFFLRKLISAAQNIDELPACKQFKEAGDLLDKIAPGFISIGFPSSARVYYDQLEEHVEPCIQDIQFVDEDSIDEAIAMKIPFVTFDFMLEIIKTAAKYNMLHLVTSLTEAISAADISTPLDYLLCVQKFLTDFKAYAREDYADLFKDNIGIYTIEQEADDLAAEWVHNLGFNPQIVIDENFAMLAVREETHAPQLDALSSQECRALYEKNWRDENGLIVPFLGISDYSDDHHTECFRIFNISREIETHHYVFDPSRQPRLPEPSWEEIQASVKN